MYQYHSPGIADGHSGALASCGQLDPVPSMGFYVRVPFWPAFQKSAILALGLLGS